MFKRLLIVFVSLITGLLVATLVLVNPLRWSWVQPLRHSVLALIEPNHENSQEGQGQLWTCGMHPQVIQEEPGDCPICAMALTPLKDSAAGKVVDSQPEKEKKIKHWVAPMDPTYISDQPGKSPMGMDLIPVYEEEKTEDTTGIIHIDPAFVQNIGVQSVEIRRQDIPITLRTIGTVTYNEKQIYLVNTKYAGWVEGVQVNYVGEPVKKGQKLFEIYSPELVTTQKEYLSALDYAERLKESDYPDIKERARSLVSATKERLRHWDITEEQITDLERTSQPQRTLTVFSPADGLVLEKMGQTLEGMYAQPGMNLYKIVDLSTVWVEAEIFENQIPWLKVGQTATLEFASHPGKTYRGAVRYLYPFLNQRTRTMKVSIELTNSEQKLRADMYADVTFRIPTAHNVLTVPENSVIHSGRRNLVVLDRGEGTFQPREVVLGINGDGVWEVQEGLREGDRVVISSQFLLDSESNLREAIQKMIAARAQGEPNTEESMETKMLGGHDH
jgi:Cu(I)/Ag(I) efflux system membrane fusion protein/cobalt-zinc-cadmium efflux system membrane fusion protein